MEGNKHITPHTLVHYQKNSDNLTAQTSPSSKVLKMDTISAFYNSTIQLAWQPIQIMSDGSFSDKTPRKICITVIKDSSKIRRLQEYEEYIIQRVGRLSLPMSSNKSVGNL